MHERNALLTGNLLNLMGLALLVAVALAIPFPTSARGQELVVYSGRREPLIAPALAAFQEATGIQVTLRSGGASELANLILEEQNNPQADIFIANDAGTLEKLRQEGVLEPYSSAAVAAIPAEFRAADGSWVGVSGRGRVIMYNSQLLSLEELPQSVFDLTDPKWRGQVAMASTSNESVIAWVSSLRILRGDEFTRQYFAALRDNAVQVLGGHTDVRQAVGRGEFKLGLVNHYYFHLEVQAGSPVGVIYPDQGAGQVGVLVNTAGAAIVRGTQHLEAAQALIDFLLTPQAQDLFARTNFEYPLLLGVQPFEARPLDSFVRSPVALEQLGRELDATVALLEDIGL